MEEHKDHAHTENLLRNDVKKMREEDKKTGSAVSVLASADIAVRVAQSSNTH